MTNSPVFAFALAWAACLAMTVLLIVALMPVWQRKALAFPDARSSHKAPTPQGGGLAVMLAVLCVMWAAPAVLPALALPLPDRMALSLAMVALVIVGAWDDIKPLPPAPRLAIQALAGALVLASTPALTGIFPFLPAPVTWAVLLAATVWFVNLVNFMDGLDWLTVAGLTPACAAVALFALHGYAPAAAGYMAAALCGALLGFAIFNKPVARLFLGDVGSLPIGLSVAWLLYSLAASGHLAAAVLLPLYYCSDATVTLVRRMARGENLATAHRSHFYQRATTNGFTALQIAGMIAAANLLLALLAWVTIVAPSTGIKILCLIAGGMMVSALLWRFQQPRRVTA